jgi:hypothetical protein
MDGSGRVARFAWHRALSECVCPESAGALKDLCVAVPQMWPPRGIRSPASDKLYSSYLSNVSTSQNMMPRVWSPTSQGPWIQTHTKETQAHCDCRESRRGRGVHDLDRGFISHKATVCDELLRLGIGHNAISISQCNFTRGDTLDRDPRNRGRKIKLLALTIVRGRTSDFGVRFYKHFYRGS